MLELKDFVRPIAPVEEALAILVPAVKVGWVVVFPPEIDPLIGEEQPISGFGEGLKPVGFSASVDE